MTSIDPIERWNLAISAGAVATSLALATPAFATSLAVGAALEAANFRALRRSAQFLFSGVLPSQRAWGAVFGLRFALLAIGIGAALYFGADALGLLIGLSLIMPATLIEAWRSRPPIDPNAPRLDDDDPSWDRWNPWLARESAPRDDGEEPSA
ncbi:MAG TPA: hypothetical protein VEC18_08825 [Myxococcota bacterium]|nr:hypothetical protein [Myxococcota bacterium]